MIMKKYEVIRYTEHTLQSDKYYVCSFGFVTNNQQSHTLHYRSKFGFTQECELESVGSSDRLRLVPDQGLSGFKVNLLKDNHLVAIYANRTLTDTKQNPLVRVVDPTGVTKAILRNIVQGDPNEYLFLSKDSDVIIARLKRVQLNTRFPWPISSLVKLVSVFLRPTNQPIYFLDIEEDTNVEWLMAVAVMIDANKNSGTAAL